MSGSCGGHVLFDAHCGNHGCRRTAHTISDSFLKVIFANSADVKNDILTLSFIKQHSPT